MTIIGAHLLYSTDATTRNDDNGHEWRSLQLIDFLFSFFFHHISYTHHRAAISYFSRRNGGGMGGKAGEGCVWSRIA